MGKWNRRYMPRRNFRKHEYEDPSSPPWPSIHSPTPGTGNNRVPSWEIDYCNSAKVPWRKILASKRYIYCYPTVLEWDASAGEEALRNAKQRYWSTINNLPNETPLPDPDMYIGEIDWNPYMDPELMADLELQAFDPDKVQDVGNLETIDEGVEYSQSQCDKNQSTTDDNPWERGRVQGAGISKGGEQGGWPKWDEDVNSRNENPWEQSEKVDSFKDNAWESVKGSWGCNNNGNYTSQEGWGGWGDDSNCTSQERWGRWGDDSNCTSQERWGCWGDDSRGYVRGNSNGRGFKSFGNSGYACGNYVQTGSKERRWEDNRNNSWNQRGSEWQVNEQKNMGSWNYERGGMSSGCRKRESFQQNSSKFKSSRCHGDTWQ